MATAEERLQQLEQENAALRQMMEGFRNEQARVAAMMVENMQTQLARLPDQIAAGLSQSREKRNLIEGLRLGS